MKHRHCVNCGREVMSDDSGGWLHTDGSRDCGLVAYPDPEREA